MINEQTNHNRHLFHGLKDGELIHILDAVNGKKCDCICPACKKELVAHNGGSSNRLKTFHHFENKECKYGFQTAIHLAAKKVFELTKEITIPEVKIFIPTGIELIDGQFISHGFFREISPCKKINIDRVILEKRLHKYIPDVVVFSLDKNTGKEKRLIVEIAVTHFVGRKKIKDIIDSDISAIEIDLSSVQNDFNFEELKRILVEETENKKWLYNKKSFEEAQKQLTIKVDFDRKIWYKQNYKEIVKRITDNYYPVFEVHNCKLNKRKYKDKYYANIDLDCSSCNHFHGLWEERKYLLCNLHTFRLEKKNIASLLQKQTS